MFVIKYKTIFFVICVNFWTFTIYVRCEFWGFHTGVNRVCGLPACDAGSLGDHSPNDVASHSDVVCTFLYASNRNMRASFLDVATAQLGPRPPHC
jgi:hypothetical protein